MQTPILMRQSLTTSSRHRPKSTLETGRIRQDKSTTMMMTVLPVRVSGQPVQSAQNVRNVKSGRVTTVAMQARPKRSLATGSSATNPEHSSAAPRVMMTHHVARKQSNPGHRMSGWPRALVRFQKRSRKALQSTRQRKSHCVANGPKVRRSDMAGQKMVSRSSRSVLLILTAKPL